ncbi:MAG TPA: cytochrome c [Rhodanobacteraceae bacterium]|nr:cytochrome c [Rhodanobacteraceae bacterium]
MKDQDRIRRRIIACLVGAAALVAAAAIRPAQADSSHAAIQRGHYLVRAGDCRACHTAVGGQPFAGGRAIPTPFGIIYSTNITPDRDTGIGDWTDADFHRAMHSGIDRQGKRLYPAFPYPWYTRLTAGDVRAIRLYLGTLEPIRQIDRPNELPWPLGIRGLMAVWDAMYFDAGTFHADPEKPEAWNRGAYLVRGLGHCGACHTDKNFAGAADSDHPLQGGYGENAFAPSLAGDLGDGLGAWSVAEIAEYLQTGSNDKSSAAGPMAEVVSNSTQYLTDADAAAIASYLKDLPRTGADDRGETGAVDKQVMSHGAAIYADDCSGCHMGKGEGLAHVFPPLRGSSAIRAGESDTLVRVVLGGAAIPATTTKPTGFAMPAFSDKLSDEDIADVVNYIRNAWGNHAGVVSADDVGEMREQMKQKGG